MSRLAVTPEFLAKALFQDACPGVYIKGATFDPGRRVVLFDIEGPGVPAAEEVVATIHKPTLVIEFKAR